MHQLTTMVWSIGDESSLRIRGKDSNYGGINPTKSVRKTSNASNAQVTNGGSPARARINSAPRVCQWNRRMLPKEAKVPARNALLDTLCAQFAVLRDSRPLALGIHRSMLERMPELDVAQLRLAMKIHTSSTRYMKALLAGTERYNLDGEPAGEVTAEQREVANTALRERFKKAAERRKAEEKAQKEAQREQEAQHKRQEKLTQLAARFNQR